MTYRQDEVEYASFTVWPEVKSVLEKAVGLTRVTVDQGALGHQRRKPTCLWSNMDVIKALDGLKDDTKHAAWPDSLSRAMELSKSTAAWAPTLKGLMIREIHAIPLPQLRTLNLTEEESCTCTSCRITFLTGRIVFNVKLEQDEIDQDGGRSFTPLMR